MKKINLEGQKYNRLTVIEQCEHLRGRVAWLCKCDCGNEHKATTHDIRSGNTKSCGCWNIEQIKNRMTTHGMTKTRVFNIWQLMLRRADNKHGDKYYKDIGVCDRWRKFENFYEDMGEPPTDKHSIDRINNEGGYCKDNCRWATKIQQMNNTRKNTFLTANGETKTVAQWGREWGLTKYQQDKIYEWIQKQKPISSLAWVPVRATPVTSGTAGASAISAGITI